jgi:hypothetical protein
MIDVPYPAAFVWENCLICGLEDCHFPDIENGERIMNYHGCFLWSRYRSSQCDESNELWILIFALHLSKIAEYKEPNIEPYS